MAKPPSQFPLPSSRGLGPGQDLVKRRNGEASPSRGLQHTTSLIPGGLQATCTWACSPKDPPETGRNNKPKGMRPVFLAKVLRWAVICRAGQDAGISNTWLHSPWSNGAESTACGARWLWLPPPPPLSLLSSLSLHIYCLSPSTFAFFFPAIIFPFSFHYSHNSCSLPLLQLFSCSEKRGVVSPFVLISW